MKPGGECGQSTHVVELKTQVAGQDNMPIHTVLVATKAYQTVAALEALHAQLVPDAVMVVLSNGVLALSEDIAASPALAGRHTILGSTTHGAWVRDDLNVVHAGIGRTWFGHRPQSHLEAGRYAEILAQLNKSGLGASDTGVGFLRHAWLKLAANAVINPLTALWEVPNGDILMREEGLAALRSVCQEISDVATTMAIRELGPEGYSSLQLPSAKELEEFVRRVAAQTAGNRSSMLQDILAGRPTEIEFLNGWLAKKGQELGVRTSVCARLADSIRQKT